MRLPYFFGTIFPSITSWEKMSCRIRWKREQSKPIGPIGKQSSSIYFLVAPHGGIRPAERRRSRLPLTLAEREVIFRGVNGTSIANDETFVREADHTSKNTVSPSPWRRISRRYTTSQL